MRRLRGAVPPSGITGATFVDGRMYVAGQGGGPFRVYSIDLADGSHRLEIERTIAGESEGLVTAALKGGTLSWLIQPFTTEGETPTYDPDNGDAAELPRAGRRRGRARRPRRPATARASRPRSASCAARAARCSHGAASRPAWSAPRAAARG